MTFYCILILLFHCIIYLAILGSVPLLSSTTVRISMLPGNAELPKFGFVDPLNKIPETTSVSSVAFTVDAGSSNAAYSIVGGNTGDAFAINKHGQVGLVFYLFHKRFFHFLPLIFLNVFYESQKFRTQFVLLFSY